MAKNIETTKAEIPEIEAFDLPDVSGGTKAKPRVHDFSNNACISCEG